ncbi:MAG TPA: ATP-binding protein, partial [Pyrinomonadaceae bacterium]
MDEQLLREFLAGAEDHFEALFADIKLLRARRDDGRARRELTARVFRHVHTIKGTASAAGLAGVGRLAHEFETLLEAVRGRRVAADDDVLDASEDAVEAMSSLIAGAAHARSDEPAQELVERLRLLASAGGEDVNASAFATRADALDELPAELAVSLGEDEARRLREAVGEGARAYALTVDFDLADFDERFRELSRALSETGEVVATLPGASARAAAVNFRIVYASNAPREEIERLVAPFGVTLIDGRDATEGAATGEGFRPGVFEETEGVASVPAGEFDEVAGAEEALASSPSPALSRLTMLVRVPLGVLDELISDTHELFAAVSGALEHALESLPEGDATRAELETRAPLVRRGFVDLEERLTGLRMAPVRQTLERAARVGASTARAAGREVEFETAGGDVCLDRPLAEAVTEALLHLVRNAVHHGVETAEERRAAGKPARGRVRLEAVAEGARVLLRVTDDGRGVDVESVARAARRRGVIEAGASLTERQALRLIFRPGFSTAAQVSDASGRGVGLDVVERMVEAAGGEMRVWSRAGAGATFELRLPTTLALVPTVVVRACGRAYCLDAGHVAGAGAARLSDARDERGRTLVDWDGDALPFVSLGELLGADDDHHTATVAGGQVRVILSSAREGAEAEARPRRVAVGVEDFEERGEVLVRWLGRHATRWRGVSGAAELADGTVALLLDLPRLL